MARPPFVYDHVDGYIRFDFSNNLTKISMIFSICLTPIFAYYYIISLPRRCTILAELHLWGLLSEKMTDYPLFSAL